MTFTVDHILVMCASGAPEGEALVEAGLVEGSPNTHPGQGTANRRFFFENAFLELLFVTDAEEARREPAARTRLWERWSQRSQGACPFGIVFASTETPAPEPPFRTWSYQPSYSPVAIDIGLGTPLGEPELFYFRFARRPGAQRSEPRSHRLGLKKLTGVSIGLPRLDARSDAARAVEAAGLVSFFASKDYAMRLAFDGARAGNDEDFRPALPLVLAW